MRQCTAFVGVLAVLTYRCAPLLKMGWYDRQGLIRQVSFAKPCTVIKVLRLTRMRGRFPS